ncbi:uncharacterized protein Z518_04660 [Rhinocladiella mackenziei CBS 650.93]|uniref:Uncharacterized protein n=1 Tax=Rhinocladiella mackenziei CBS 650.93 TaxID=1442369 RepID=A0A0D2ILP6_9EURO|nr:uncharacterized protein Z518_04660 [Rhinocladiella mackenziei CBS 650.93]KIX06684.1 hypothetical protein Z518_04660 [Rhinocladiella mackenziei CBS 650.93]
MVLYKPTKRYLAQVLEWEEQNYGEPFGPAISNQLMQDAEGVVGFDLDPAQVDAQMENHLITKLTENPDWRDPDKMNKFTVGHMEESFRTSEYLNWEDIEYAYAYRGVIIPRGKIMMGRYWRCGMLGSGDGLELDADGQSLHGGNDSDGNVNAMDDHGPSMPPPPPPEQGQIGQRSFRLLALRAFVRQASPLVKAQEHIDGGWHQRVHTAERSTDKAGARTEELN